MGNVLQSRDDLIDNIIRLNVLDNFSEFEARDAFNLWLDIIDVFDQIGEEGLKFLRGFKDFSHFLHFGNELIAHPPGKLIGNEVEIGLEKHWVFLYLVY